MKNKAVIIFDLDGTLYQIDGKSSGYIGSTLETSVIDNAQRFVVDRGFASKKTAAEFISKILVSGVGISNYLVKKYGVDRKEYFSFVWQINPEKIVQNFAVAREAVNFLAQNNYKLILLTGAPKVWQESVLKFINLQNYFKEIYTAEDFIIKEEIFEELANRFDSNLTWSIGDQVETDLIPAQKFGIKTLLINNPNDLLDFAKRITKNNEK